MKLAFPVRSELNTIHRRTQTHLVSPPNGSRSANSVSVLGCDLLGRISLLQHGFDEELSGSIAGTDQRAGCYIPAALVSVCIKLAQITKDGGETCQFYLKHSEAYAGMLLSDCHCRRSKRKRNEDDSSLAAVRLILSQTGSRLEQYQLRT